MAGGARAGRARARARGDPGRGLGVVRLTAAQALVRFLAAQYVERDGVEHRFFAGCFGIFGHGNVAGIGEALLREPRAADLLPGAQRAGDGAHRRRLRRMQEPARRRSRARRRSGRARRTWSPARRSRPSTGCRCCCCRATSSPRARPRPGAPAARGALGRDVSVNDCFRPVSRYFDRIWRPEQVVPAALAGDARARRARPRPARSRSRSRRTCRPRRSTTRTSFLEKRVWPIPRPLPDEAALARAVELIRAAQAAADRRRRRRHLLRGDRGAARALRADGHSRRRDAGRQGLAALRPSLCARRDRRRRARSPPTGSPPTPIS